MTRPDIGIEFVTQAFGSATEHDVYLVSLGNDRGDPNFPTRHLRTRNPDDIAAFARRHDKAGRGVFFCVGTIRPDAAPSDKGSYKAKDNISELCLLHADTDLKDIEIGLDEARRRILALPLPPSIIVRSGHGLHSYWLLKEAFGQDDRERIEGLYRQLADLVGGDMQVCEISRLMRLPGTHNSKDGGWVDVDLAHADFERRYDLVEIEDMLSIASPAIMRRAPDGEPLPRLADNPFLLVASKYGFKPPLDVEQALSAMNYKGSNQTSIHETQLKVSASLLNSGIEQDRVVEIIMGATRAAAGGYADNWNWVREERTVRDMCSSWVRKNPPAPRPALRAVPDQSIREDIADEATGTTGAKVVRLGEARQKRQNKDGKPKGAAAISIVIADGVIEAIREEGGDILLTEGDLWLYREGVWTVASAAEEQWIKTLIQRGCDTLGASGDTRSANAAWKRLTEHPDVYHRHVPWDQGDTIATENGMLDLRTRAFVPHDSSFFARRKIGTAYEAGRGCPKFLTFLTWCFDNRPAADRGDFVRVFQDFFGASLAIRTLSRAQRKALFLLGPSQTGKTQVAVIVRRLIGDPVAAPSIVDLTKEFGLQALYGARAWIRDDAVNEGDLLDPGRFKTVVTGEPVDVNRKGKAYVTVSFEMPVLLTANAMPRARDATDAIYNRCIVIEMTNIVSEEKARVLAEQLGFSQAAVLADGLFEEEGPGILNWALEGLDRLRKAGRYDLPETIKTSVQHFKDSNNPIGEWARSALKLTPYAKVSNADLLCSYHGWIKEAYGDDAKASGGVILQKNLRVMLPSIELGVKTHGTRYIGGLALTDEGLSLWAMHKDDPLRGGSKGSSTTKNEINRAWKSGADDDGGGDDTHF